MGPLCRICRKHLISIDKFYSTLCGHVFHRECIEEQLEIAEECPSCEKVVFPSQLKRIWFAFSKNEVELTAIIKKEYEDQINCLEKEQHKKDDQINCLKKEQHKKDDQINYLKKDQHMKDQQITNLEQKIQTLNTSLESKCKELSATHTQLKNKHIKLDSKIKELANSMALLRDAKILTTNLYDLVKEDLKKCALMSAQEEVLKSNLECHKARCAELEKTIEHHSETAMKETTLRQQFQKEVAAFAKEKSVIEKRVLELEDMNAKLISSKVNPAEISEIFGGQKRELEDESATGNIKSDRKRIKVGKNTKENAPTSQRILRSSNQNTLQNV